jgi:hypothetical protein
LTYKNVFPYIFHAYKSKFLSNKLSKVFHRKCLKYSDNPQELKEVNRGFQELLESFYSEVSDYMPPQHHHAAGKNIEYFIRLIDLALAYFVHGMKAEGEIQ